MYIAVSPSGISYDLDHEERKECCIACGGRGFHWYETPEDLASFNAALDEWIDGDSDDECPEPSATGRKPCERCNGTGTLRRSYRASLPHSCCGEHTNASSAMTIYHIDRYGARFDIEVGHDDHAKAVYERGLLSEHHMLDWIEANVPHDGCWIDAGANIGNHALAFALWADRVIAIEPVRENFTRLERNIARNPMGILVVAVRLAVGREPALVGARKGGSGQDSQYLMDGPGSIPVVVLDHLVPTDMPVRLLKMDVEGMEEAALDGAMRIIQQWKPEIFVEIWEADLLKRITATLAARGYKLIERWGEAPTYHFSASGRYPVTYRKP